MSAIGDQRDFVCVVAQADDKQWERNGIWTVLTIAELMDAGWPTIPVNTGLAIYIVSVRSADDPLERCSLPTVARAFYMKRGK